MTGNGPKRHTTPTKRDQLESKLQELMNRNQDVYDQMILENRGNDPIHPGARLVVEFRALVDTFLPPGSTDRTKFAIRVEELLWEEFFDDGLNKFRKQKAEDLLRVQQAMPSSDKLKIIKS